MLWVLLHFDSWLRKTPLRVAAVWVECKYYGKINELVLCWIYS